jgi:hypothetical protein
MKFARTKSGLLLPTPKPPTPEERQAARTEAYRQYGELHKCCPQCGGKNICQTCIGYVMTDPSKYEDRNQATCQCGWRGVVHDMVPEKSESGCADD